MNYTDKHKLTNRIVYISISIMAVTILCVTLYTVFSSPSRRQDNEKLPMDSAETRDSAVTTKEAAQTAPESTHSGVVLDPETDAEIEVGSHETEREIEAGGDVTDPISEVGGKEPEPAEEVSVRLKLQLPVVGGLIKRHDLTTPVFSLTMNDYRVHNGIDIEGAIGDNVYCCADGIVKNVFTDPFMGVCVTVEHGSGLVSYYKNLDKTLAEGITESSKISAGQIIGSIGESAAIEIADTPHLHFEMTQDGKSADPAALLGISEEEAAIAAIGDE